MALILLDSGLEFVIEAQRRLAACEHLIADRQIFIGDTWAHPSVVAIWLAEEAGIEVDCEVATRGIGRMN